MIRRTGIDIIAAERARHVNEEGWTPEHDAEHGGGQLAVAAACYAIPEDQRERRGLPLDTPPLMWPWSDEWWKPSPADRVKELAKAGSLIAAEIDRLLLDEPA